MTKNPKTWKAGSWIQTYTGRRFYPFSPSVYDVDIKDIAHALSNQCRYAGHCRRFYSVAEHSILMAEKAPMALKLPALLHDAGEAYLTDVPSPIKRFMPEFKRVEDEIEQVVYKRFGMAFPLSPEVKRLDVRIRKDEASQAMGGEAVLWDTDRADAAEPLGVALRFYSPAEAEAAFLALFYSLSNPF